jgi:stage II sporulation protein D
MNKVKTQKSSAYALRATADKQLKSEIASPPMNDNKSPAARNDITLHPTLSTLHLIIIGLILFIFLPSCVSMQYVYTSGSPVKIKKGELANSNNSRSSAQPASKEPSSTSGSVIQAEDEKKLNDVNLKVLIAKNTGEIEISSSDNIKVKGNDAVPGFSSGALSLSGSKVVVNGYSLADNVVELVSKGFMEVKGKKYRGTFLVTEKDGQLLVINKVKLNEYLYGVLPSEVSSSWPIEILKAQAVAARSFALYNRMNNKIEQYDLDSNTMSQVYKGMGIEDKRANDAIDETENEVLTKDGQVIQAFFHANSGGKTASSEEVWGGKFDYLKSVDDEYCGKGQHYKWELKVDRTRLSDILSKNKLKVGEIYQILITDRTGSGRVKTMKIYGSDGTAEVQGKDFRAYAGVDNIKSTNFIVEVKGDKYVFEGLGWGHGVGMSQEGGKGMAEAGRGYKDILTHFYQGAEIKKAKLE